MITVAICDDDKVLCAQIERILLDYSKGIHLQLESYIFYCGESLLNYLRQGNCVDLIFLDIEMEGINGIEVAHQIRTIHKNYICEIIFISGSDNYDRQLFDVQPLHFISKPLKEGCLIDDLKLYIERARKTEVFFKYQKGHDIYKIPMSEIIYFESINRKIKMVTITEEITFYGCIEELAIRLVQHQFIQIHRSYLISYNHANTLRFCEVLMSNGAVLPISRTKRQKLRSLQINEGLV